MNANIFYFRCLVIMVSSYTANLATFLVVPEKVSAISSVKDLENCGVEGFECPIKFGAKSSGATMTFFAVIIVYYCIYIRKFSCELTFQRKKIK